MLKKTYELICIEDFNYEKCIFKKNAKYTMNYDKYRNYNDMYNTRLYDDKNNYISFDMKSEFNRDTISKYFITLKEYRKQKILKIEKSNETR